MNTQPTTGDPANIKPEPTTNTTYRKDIAMYGMPFKYRYGWICPMCMTIYAPWVITCSCNIKEQYTEPTTTWDTTPHPTQPAAP